MRHSRVIVGLVLLAVGSAVGLWPRGPRPCKAMFDVVREGMTFDEVCATVGERPWITRWFPESNPVKVGDDPCVVESIWAADDAEMQVLFDAETGRACSVIVDEHAPDTRPFLIRLRARLGL